MPLLELTGVTKRFGAVQALNGVDFEVERRRGRRPRRRQRRRQVDADQGDRRASSPPTSGEYRSRASRSSVPTPAGRDRARDRDRLPGPRAVRQPRRRREPVPRPGGDLAGASRSWTRPRWSKARTSCSTSSRVTTIAASAPRSAALSGGQRQSVAIARSLLGEPEDRDPRRADRGARRRADRRRCSTLIERLREPRPRRRRDQPQPRRRLRGRRPDRRPAARAHAAATFDAEQRQPRGRRRRDHRRRRRTTPDEGRQPVSSDAAPTPTASRGGRRGQQESLPSLGPGILGQHRARASSARCGCWSGWRRSGRSSRSPDDRFLLAINLTNLTLQITAVATDLGRRRAGAAARRDRPLGRRRQRPLRGDHGRAHRQARLGAGSRRSSRASRSAPRSASSRAHGDEVRDPVVRRHAGRAARLAGRAARVLGDTGTVNLPDQHDHRPGRQVLRRRSAGCIARRRDRVLRRWPDSCAGASARDRRARGARR